MRQWKVLCATSLLGAAFGVGLQVVPAQAECNDLLPVFIAGSTVDGSPTIICAQPDPPGGSITCYTDYVWPARHAICDGAATVAGWCCNNTAVQVDIYPPRCENFTCVRGLKSQQPHPAGDVKPCMLPSEAPAGYPENCKFAPPPDPPPEPPK